jgi:hypothetical protein
MMLTGGSAEQCCLRFAAVRPRRVRAGRGSPRDETVRGNGVPTEARGHVTTGGRAIPNRPRKRADDGRQRRDTRFPLEIRRFVEFYQAYRGHYLIFERFH